MALLELGATLTLLPRDAYVLERKLGLHEHRLAVRGNPALQEFHGLLQLIHQLAINYAESDVVGRAGSAGRKLPEAVSDLSSMSCADVADLLGDITDRGVRDAATSGRLVGAKDAKGRWSFGRDDVLVFGASRNRSAA